MEDDLSLHLQSVWQSPKIGFYCLNAAASAELVEIFFLWSVWLGQSGIDGVEGGDCLKSQIFLSENRKSVSGLVSGYGVFQSREDFSDSLGGMQKGLAKTLANPLQERKRQDSNLRTALGRSTVFEAASFSHSDTLPGILLGLCPKLSQFPHPPFQGSDQGLRAFHRRWAFPARQLRPGI